MTTPSPFSIGRDVTRFGRWVRIVLGLLFVLAAGLSTISRIDRVAPLPLFEFLVAILVVYFVAYLALEKLLLSRGNAWLNALVFVVPSLVIVLVPLFPAALRAAMTLYWGVMMFINALVGYGGCEVLALPTLIFRRRYNVYCPTNAVDLAEQAVAGKGGKPS